MSISKTDFTGSILSASRADSDEQGTCAELTVRELARLRASYVVRTDGCWMWTASIADTGYGRFFYRGKHRLAHRFMYELQHGPIGAGLDTDHLCRNRFCVNPAHLEAVTHAENIKRGMDARGLGTDDPVRKPRQWVRGPNPDSTLLTHCRKGHEYTPDNTYVVPNREVRARRCRECGRQAQRRERARGAVLRENARAANTRLDSIESLCESFCSTLRVTARWSPGTLRLLLGDKAVTP